MMVVAELLFINAHWTRSERDTLVTEIPMRQPYFILLDNLVHRKTYGAQHPMDRSIISGLLIPLSMNAALQLIRA